jgi:hypothetical protein
MLNESQTECWLADEPIQILRFAKQRDSWLQCKIDFVRNMFDLAVKNKRFDLAENYRFAEDIFIKTRIYKNSDAKEKRELKKRLEKKAIIRLKEMWKNDYESFIDTLYGEHDFFRERYKINFETFQNEILCYATYHETTEQICHQIKISKNDKELLKVLSEYPKY